MTKKQIDEAIAQMRSLVAEKEAAYRRGEAEYASLSAREVLYELGYARASADVVLLAIAGRGFEYCLDPIVPSKDGEGATPRFACVWGVDQLRSRLDCVRA